MAMRGLGSGRTDQDEAVPQEAVPQEAVPKRPRRTRARRQGRA